MSQNSNESSFHPHNTRGSSSRLNSHIFENQQLKLRRNFDNFTHDFIYKNGHFTFERVRLKHSTLGGGQERMVQHEKKSERWLLTPAQRIYYECCIIVTRTRWRLCVLITMESREKSQIGIINLVSTKVDENGEIFVVALLCDVHVYLCLLID